MYEKLAIRLAIAAVSIATGAGIVALSHRSAPTAGVAPAAKLADPRVLASLPGHDVDASAITVLPTITVTADPTPVLPTVVVTASAIPVLPTIVVTPDQDDVELAFTPARAESPTTRSSGSSAGESASVARGAAMGMPYYSFGHSPQGLNGRPH